MTKKNFWLLTVLLFSSCARDNGAPGSSGGGDSATVTVVNNRTLLSWAASSGLPDGYYVEQSSDGVSWSQVQNVTETSTYLDGLTSGTTYYFRVRAYNSTGPSSYTGIVTVTP